MANILVIRGGAIGDFLLTLPAIGLLRLAFPEAWIEVLGYRHIVALAEKRYYADAIRSIEYGGMASFFIPNGKLPEELVVYFSDFDQVISYLYDPDGFFEANLRRAGVQNLISGTWKVDATPGSAHAARQLARPMEQLALFLEEGQETAPLHLTDADHALAAEHPAIRAGRPLLALHPGSGGAYKQWSLDHWQQLTATLRNFPDAPQLLFVGGEADQERIAVLRQPGDAEASHLPLPQLAALLSRCRAFLGHDSGISHLAAAVGTPSTLLFGPTDASIWAPVGKHVTALEAPNGFLDALTPEAVLQALLPNLS